MCILSTNKSTLKKIDLGFFWSVWSKLEYLFICNYRDNMRVIKFV